MASSKRISCCRDLSGIFFIQGAIVFFYGSTCLTGYIMSDKNLSIPFKLVNIEEKQFSVFEEVLKLEKPIQEKVSTGFGVDVESRVIGSSVEYMLLKEDKPMLHIEVVCYFEIEEKAFNKKLVRADK